MLAVPRTRPLFQNHAEFSRFRAPSARIRLRLLSRSPAWPTLRHNLNQQLKARIKELSPAIAGAISIAIGIIALSGWALHIEFLRSFGLGLIAMNPVTAFVVMLTGGALILLSDRQANRPRRLWGRILAGIAASVGVL